MFRATEMFRWGGVSFLVAGLATTVLGLAGGDPSADRFAAALALFTLAGFAAVSVWLLRLLARPLTAAVEAPPGRRARRITLICATPAILLLNAALFPTHHTWVLGLVYCAGGVMQLVFAGRVARLERTHGARVLRHDRKGFFLAH